VTTRTAIQEETKCLGCVTPGPQSICELRCDASPSKTGKLLPDSLRPSGFEVAHRLSLFQLVEDRLGVESPEGEVLFLTHPLLLLQYLFTHGDLALVFPFAAILSGHGRSTHVGSVGSGNPAEHFVAAHERQTEGELIRAASGLGEGFRAEIACESTAAPFGVPSQKAK